MLAYNKNLKSHGRRLRRNMTEAERRLWSKIRMKQIGGCQFYRQRIIGCYIVDFFCPRARLVVEVDGGQHYSGQVAKAGRRRDEYLVKQGLRVLRFSDAEVLSNVEGVVEDLMENMRSPLNPIAVQIHKSGHQACATADN